MRDPFAVVIGGIIVAACLLAYAFLAGVLTERRRARRMRAGRGMADAMARRGITFADPDWQPVTVPHLVLEPATPPAEREAAR